MTYFHELWRFAGRLGVVEMLFALAAVFAPWALIWLVMELL